MRKLKNSNIEWIGLIPSHWELNKIGAIYEERNIRVSDKEYPPLSVTKNGISPQLETAAKTDNGDDRKLICKNDFVINSRSDRRGSCGISELEGSCSLINIVLKPRKKTSNIYYNFVFHSDLFADEFYKWGNGIVDDLWTTKWTRMKNIYIPAPPLSEQEHIANYLLQKCHSIDNAIKKEKETIDKLEEYKLSCITEAVTKGLDPSVPMKDSGMDWVGMIPQHWKICRLRNIGTVQNGISKSGGYFGHGSPFIAYGDVYKNFSIPKQVTGCLDSTPKEQTLYSVQAGDIFFTRTSETIDEIGFSAVCEETIPHATFAGFLIRVRPFNHYLTTDFAKYYFRSNHQRYYFTKQMNLVTRASLSQDLLKSMPILLPPHNEQKKIAAYLDKKFNSIQNAITQKQEIINKLMEYKKSLIYEVVTGKKEV